jgi:hypothetical protein
MRFMMCACDRRDGGMSLVSNESFPNRREAVEAMEAIVGSSDIRTLLVSDIFLVDLETATPVALVNVGDIGLRSASRPEPSSGSASAGLPSQADRPADGVPEAEPGASEEPTEDKSEASGLGLVEIDIESWTCEDCIYVLTCERSGTQRPAECGSFQWRA